ncbi:Reductase C-terminal [Nocardioides sp. YR527]|uniref:NAD(P)/FAD-dependent oxidoreductase n=1 Tax=Nocardioides sp. YR527 TaxID=1881028 RepID=UPI0008802C4C|nr:FAD-dependent oxidoreductase [Nocardioides sp. YR527]SDK08963.1 Reductase C-terminal [Nocardioides sp. YR527]
MTVSSVLVVGGGIAGVSTVAELRKNGFVGELTLLSADAVPYDRPPLSKDYLAGARDLESIALQPAEWYADQRVSLVGDTVAVAMRPDAGEVELADGQVLTADRIVLATGGRAVLPAIAQVRRDVPAALPTGKRRERPVVSPIHVLREVSDADRLRTSLVPGARLLIVGGGLIGAEVASTARGLGVEVVLVDPLAPPLAAAVGIEVATWLHGLHADHGVEALTTTVETLLESPTGIAAQLKGEPDSREFDAVLLAVGLVPEAGLAEAAGLETSRGILVDADQTTSHPSVLAVGDCSRLRDHHRAEHWEAAQLDGARAAATILGSPPPPATAPWWWSDRYGLHVEGVGEMRSPDAEHQTVVRGVVGEPPFAVFTLRGERLLGAVAVDDANAAKAARRLIDRAADVRASDLADPTQSLRTLLRR